jgi:hypothetical protein
MHDVIQGVGLGSKVSILYAEGPALILGWEFDYSDWRVSKFINLQTLSCPLHRA